MWYAFVVLFACVEVDLDNFLYIDTACYNHKTSNLSLFSHKLFSSHIPPIHIVNGSTKSISDSKATTNYNFLTLFMFLVLHITYYLLVNYVNLQLLSSFLNMVML